MISLKECHYRYPSTLASLFPSLKDPTIVTGVLSNAPNAAARQVIRETWGAGRPVFFIVAGAWHVIEEEFIEKGDLIWLDMEEDYKHLAYKTKIFLAAVAAHVDHYDYIFKTDDDCFIGLEEIHLIAKTHKPEYWGYCSDKHVVFRDPNSKWYTSVEVYAQDFYPSFATGASYLLSQNLSSCVTEKMTNTSYLPWEDAATGILVKECGGRCSSEGMPGGYIPWESQDRLLSVPAVVNSERSPEMIIEHYWQDLKNQHMQKWKERNAE